MTTNQLCNSDPKWCLVGECSPVDQIPSDAADPEGALGKIFHAIRSYGLSTANINQIQRAIEEATRSAKSQYSQDSSPCLPLHVCLFCQRKLIENDPACDDRNAGGWGYFFIQKAVNSPDLAGQEQHISIELYLYREGQ